MTSKGHQKGKKIKIGFAEESFLVPSPGQCARPSHCVCESIHGKQNILMLYNPPYSPDVAHCDFCLFPKMKSELNRTRFENVESVKAKVRRKISISCQKRPSSVALHSGKFGWRDHQEKYIKGDKICDIHSK